MKSRKKIFTFIIGYLTTIYDNQVSKYIQINSVNPLCFITNKINAYFEKSNGNKYLTLQPWA